MIVVETLADEADDQPVFADEESTEHRTLMLPPITSAARKTKI